MTFTKRSLALVLLWALGLVLVFVAGAITDGYPRTTLDAAKPESYSWRGVLLMAGMLSAESVLFYALIRPESYRRLWGRALVALVVCVCLIGLFGLAILHAPAYVTAHLLWLALTAGILFILLVVSIIGAGSVRAA